MVGERRDRVQRGRQHITVAQRDEAQMRCCKTRLNRGTILLQKAAGKDEWDTVQGRRWPHESPFFAMKCTRCSVVRFDQPGCSYCVLCHMLLRRRRAACTQLHSCLFLFSIFCSFEYNILTTDIHKQYSKYIIVLAVQITNK